MGLYDIKRTMAGVAFVLAAWQLIAHNQHYDPSHLTLENMVVTATIEEKVWEGNKSFYLLNYGILAFGAYWVARGVSEMKL